MNIAVIYQGIFPPLKGASGSDRRVRDLTRGLAFDNEVCMLVPSNKNKGQTNPDSNDYSIRYLGGSLLKSNNIANKLGFWMKVRKYCLQNKMDVVLFYNTSFESIPIAKSLKKAGLFIVYEICDEPSATLSGIGKMRTKISEDSLPKIANLNIVISEYLMKKVKLLAPQTPAILIPVMADERIFLHNAKKAEKFRRDNCLSNEDTLIAYVGGTWKEEGVATILHALASERIRGKKVKLVIAGRLTNSPNHDDIVGIIHNLDLNDSVILPGWVNTDDVVSIYSAADIAVLPQIQHGFNVAGLPTKSAEYASMGKAIFASAVGDIPNYFFHNKNAFLYKVGNKTEMQDKLNTLIDNPKLRVKLGKNAKMTAQTQFNYKTSGKKILDTIKSILN